jgi:prephenate dehydrogenase
MMVGGSMKKPTRKAAAVTEDEAIASVQAMRDARLAGDSPGMARALQVLNRYIRQRARDVAARTSELKRELKRRKRG